MATNYIETIKIGSSGESGAVRDVEAHDAIKTLQTSMDGMTQTVNNLALTIYPVGAIYMSVNSTSPAELFGGTWEQIKDSFLLAAGSVYAAGSTGGEAEHTLTIDEMPEHSHTFDGAGKTIAKGSDYNRPVDATAYDESHTYMTTPRGGNQPHNNMPPYLAVYAWKRTA